MDGVDGALLRSDGETIAAFGPALTLPYGDGLRAAIRACLGGAGNTAAVARAVTAAHAEAVAALLAQAGMAAADIAWLGFHGHTLLHRPDARPRRTWQLGDGALLARLTGIATVSDFRSADVAMGGQGRRWCRCIMRRWPVMPDWRRRCWCSISAASATSPT